MERSNYIERIYLFTACFHNYCLQFVNCAHLFRNKLILD